MRDPKIAIADWLTSQDGSKSLGKNAEAHAATVGAHTTNDRVETNFSGFDNVLRTFESICIENASGIAQQMRMHHLDSRTDHVVHDRRHAKGAAKPVSSSVGFFDSVSSEDEGGRHRDGEAAAPRGSREGSRRSHAIEQAEYRALMRAQNLQLQLETLASKGAIASDRFEEYQNGQGVISATEMVETLDRIQAMSGKQTWLRQQIEMRVNGLGWSDLATTWQQKGESLEDSVDRLRVHLKDVLVEERVRERRGEIK